MLTIPIFQVDAFTDKPFKGNPAAVVLLEKPAEPSWMLSVAAEMNLSETAFVHPQGNGFHLRWFTPKVEVDLCGHATLASAHVLWESGMVPPRKEDYLLYFIRQAGGGKGKRLSTDGFPLCQGGRGRPAGRGDGGGRHRA